MRVVSWLIFFFFSSRRRHTRCREVSWARRCVQETGYQRRVHGVVANLLPSGVGRAVAANACPKVFVPSTGLDPEARGLSVSAQAGVLRRHLAGSGAPPESDVLGHVIVDTRNGEYPGGINRKGIRDQGLDVVDCPLVTARSAPNIDERLLSDVLCR
eukprot:TRINITY_DN23686_c0_g1_i1.p2 TRINITY_DN23686_c0_g1~~TRINITY_DN23686_c0_g1_i1.p2  ORF type:complete len:157 (+),score=77.04 TRINITY_DN23686_c0_g1_i1:46-516(+)